MTIEHEGAEYEVECDGFDNILEAAIDAGIENLSYDCLMGVCMTCPSKVTAGEIDQERERLRRRGGQGVRAAVLRLPRGRRREDSDGDGGRTAGRAARRVRES